MEDDMTSTQMIADSHPVTETACERGVQHIGEIMPLVLAKYVHVSSAEASATSRLDRKCSTAEQRKEDHYARIIAEEF